MKSLATLLLVPALLFGLVGCGTSYVRLRGSPEIHEPDCPRVRRADSAGIVPAADDGPPCFDCRRVDAVEWAEDQ